MTNEEKATELSKKYARQYSLDNVVHFDSVFVFSYEDINKALTDMAKWKDEQINLLLDAIDYAYLKTDGTYGDLALVVADKVEYLKSLRHGKIE